MNRRISILIIASLYLFAGTALANRYNNEDGDEDQYCHYRPGEHIVFNPKEICWTKCTQNGNLYHQIEGTEKLYLDIEEIRFYTK